MRQDSTGPLLMADEDELEEGLEAFVKFAESAIEHIRSNYHVCDVNTFNDLADLGEKVFELCVLLGNIIGAGC